MQRRTGGAFTPMETQLPVPADPGRSGLVLVLSATVLVLEWGHDTCLLVTRATRLIARLGAFAKPVIHFHPAFEYEYRDAEYEYRCAKYEYYDAVVCS
jgi:hypothetical protein